MFTQSTLKRINKAVSKKQSLFYFFLACKCAELNLLDKAQKYANIAGKLKTNAYYKMAVILNKKGDKENVKIFINQTGQV